jgi:hypothetical protein
MMPAPQKVVFSKPRSRQSAISPGKAPADLLLSDCKRIELDARHCDTYKQDFLILAEHGIILVAMLV